MNLDHDSFNDEDSKTIIQIRLITGCNRQKQRVLSKKI